MIYTAFLAFVASSIASISASSRVRRILFIIAFASAAWSRANAAEIYIFEKNPAFDRSLRKE